MATMRLARDFDIVVLLAVGEHAGHDDRAETEHERSAEDGCTDDAVVERVSVQQLEHFCKTLFFKKSFFKSQKTFFYNFCNSYFLVNTFHLRCNGDKLCLRTAARTFLYRSCQLLVLVNTFHLQC